jgi:DNA repair exonuclease SbcCD nuclease subunit
VKISPSFTSYSRRHFLRQLLGVGALAVTGTEALLAQNVPMVGTKAFRFAFLTDLHMMPEGALSSIQGIAQCLAAVEKLDPKPEFILVGGDLVHNARGMTIENAEKYYDLFLKTWHDNTSIPAYWVFGNHDLAGTSNATVLPTDKMYGKELFKAYLKLPRLFYSFDHNGWHFVVLDDIDLLPTHKYIGKLFDDELAFLRADLDAHKSTPTIICTHIPTLSNLPFGLLAAHAADKSPQDISNLICTNGNALVDAIPQHNVRAVLAGHLHFFERITMNGIQFINSGAVCGSYWKGPLFGCKEGYGVVDLSADGAVAFDYRDYGWKAQPS